MRKSLLAILAIAASFTACEKPAPVPAYLTINSYPHTALSTEGSSSAKITDAWIYINSEFKGAFEIPFEVPILEEGAVTIEVKPGIKLNGIASTRVANPFYTDYEIQTTLDPNSTTELFPTSAYSPLSTFEWIEDFEDAGFSVEKTTSSDTNFVLVSGADAYEGNNSIAFYLDDEHIFFEGVSTVSLDLPKTNGHIIFLEMDYKCDNPFTVGLFANENQTVYQDQILRLNPSEEWNKIYVNLTPNVLSRFQASEFKVFVGAIKEGEGVKSVFLDNLKVIYL